jgi:hypothetical protein
MLGITDLTGTDQPSFNLGVLSGTPTSGASYNGVSDLDWWYTFDPNTVGPNNQPKSHLPASISSSVLTAGPGSMDLPFPIGGVAASVHMANATITATTNTVTAPLESSTSAPPGHLPSENLDPSLTSYQALSTSSSPAKLCGAITALSLSQMRIPGVLVPGGSPSACTEGQGSKGYSGVNSMLDVLVGGCAVGGLPRYVNATQPDTADPLVPVAGAGPPYKLFNAAGLNTVDTCTDQNGAVVPLAQCLASAAYSSHFQLTADRVIVK